MPYRAAPEPSSRIHRLRFRPALALVVPALVLLASMSIALSALDEAPMASIVTCDRARCALHRAQRSAGDWTVVPCAAADEHVVTLTRFSLLVWHRIYLVDFAQPTRFVSVEEARASLVPCVNGTSSMRLAPRADPARA